MSDPDFAYNVVRPVAVVGGVLFWAWLFWHAGEWWENRPKRRKMRNVTPK